MISLEPEIIENEDELAQLSAEEEIPEFSEIENLWDQVKLLELEKLELAQASDEKISFLILVAVRLNETLLLQEQDVVSAGQFIKRLLDELSI